MRRMGASLDLGREIADEYVPELEERGLSGL